MNHLGLHTLCRCTSHCADRSQVGSPAAITLIHLTGINASRQLPFLHREWWPLIQIEEITTHNGSQQLVPSVFLREEGFSGA